MHRTCWRCVTAVFCLLVFGIASAAGAEPAALTHSERTAIEMVATYLDGGTSALWPSVIPDSALGAFGPRQGPIELEVRMGPTRDARWELTQLAGADASRFAAFEVTFPSGITDILLFDVDVKTRRLRSVRSLVEPPGETLSLASLSSLRSMLAQGDILLGGERAGRMERLLRSEAESGGSEQNAFEAATRRLWLAQYLLLRADAEGAAEILGDGDWKAPIALLLQARIADQREDFVQAHKSFRLLLGQIDADRLRWELAEMFFRAGDWTSSREELGRIRQRGSRIADAYYTLSRVAIFKHLGTAEAAFREAWDLEPQERSLLLEDPYFTHLIAAAELADFLRLDESAEPVLGPPPTLRRASTWPPGADFSVNGKHLQVAIGQAMLTVPGGGVLAPSSVAAASAIERRRWRQQRSLAAIDTLRAVAGSPTLLRSPAYRRQLEEAATSLSREAETGPANRRSASWRMLLELTASVPRADEVPAGLASLRAKALWQVGQKQEAVNLLARLSVDHEFVSENPAVVVQLAKLCAEENRPDLAARLLRRLKNLGEFPALERQIARYDLDVRLGASYETYESVHFALHYESKMKLDEVVLLGGYLEGERQRLVEWIPVDGDRRIDVHLVPARDFYRVYGGGVGILGLFDGRIRLPVFDVNDENVVMAGVLSHELAHAMIEQATNDCAPKWFHEGLAQLIEPESRQINPYRAGRKPVTMGLVENVLLGFSDSSLVAQAYQQSYWALRFVEKRESKDGIHKLLQTFSGCHSTPEALLLALDQAQDGFDRELQAWAKGPDAPIEDKGFQLAYTEEQVDHMVEMAPGFSDAIEKNLENRPGLPKVGFTGELPTQEEAEDLVVEAAQRLMEDWYQSYYADRAAVIKKDLAEVVMVLRGDRPPTRRLEEVCREISTMIVSLHISGTFESIDKDVNRTLRAAYGSLSSGTSACARGADMNPHLHKAETYLQEAAYHLDKYGLKP